MGATECETLELIHALKQHHEGYKPPPGKSIHFLPLTSSLTLVQGASQSDTVRYRHTNVPPSTLLPGVPSFWRLLLPPHNLLSKGTQREFPKWQPDSILSNRHPTPPPVAPPKCRVKSRVLTLSPAGTGVVSAPGIPTSCRPGVF